MDVIKYIKIKRKKNMLVPESCIEWINLQRTGYKNPILQFKQDMAAEYEMIKPFLGPECKSILDIGCGLCGIDIYLSEHFNSPELHLFDRNYKSDKVLYGFERGESFYNSFEAAEKLLEANDIKNYKFYSTENGFPEVEVDVIISLFSWGYHYSVTTYLDLAYKALKSGGRLIMDIREYSKGVQILKLKQFRQLWKIEHFNKAYRICCVK